MIRKIAIALTLAASPASADPVIRTTAAFADFVGVNTRPLNPDAAAAIAQLKALGIRHARIGDDIAKMPALRALCAAGVKIDMLHDGNATLADDRALGRACIAAVEEPNEINNGVVRFHYAGNLVGLPAVLAMGRSLAAQAAAWDPALPVLAPSQSVGSAPAPVADMRAMANTVNIHSYTDHGGAPNVGMPAQIAAQRFSVPGAALWMTETGYADFSPGGVSPADQAIRVVQSVLDAARFGMTKIYLYQLQDICRDRANPECQYGLFEADGAQKPAAHSIANLMRIMAAPGRVPADAPPLAVTWDGLPRDAAVLQFAAPNGAHRLVVWREQRDAAPIPAVPVKLTLPAPGAIGVYDPVAGTSPIQPRIMGGDVTFPLGADPLIVAVDQVP